jgi:Flp pilus assembly pilin Flp
MGRTMKSYCRRAKLLRCRRAATAIEYALLIALIAVSGTIAFQMTGTAVAGSMGNAAAVMPGDGITIPDPNAS